MGEADKFMISPAAANRLLAAHDGDMALLYLYLLRHGSLDPEDAARPTVPSGTGRAWQGLRLSPGPWTQRTGSQETRWLFLSP